MRRAAWSGPVLLLLLAAIGCGSSVSDTGFAGTWRRDTLDGPSSLSFRRTDAGWTVGWHVDGDTRVIRCDAAGVCDELESEQVVYRWHLSAARRPGDDALHVTRAGEPVRAGTTALTELVRYELATDGLALTAHVIERNGVALARPAGPYRYEKTSDDPRWAGR